MIDDVITILCALFFNKKTCENICIGYQPKRKKGSETK